ncbi:MULTISPECIES: low temperature requirement protein A [unclassified Microbacterium]|uniref:low temperature requirement protein A n=1 Tax=unclassified Microbacterium TaxID=2609290 RepID=UPI001DBD091C|nr:low temperature requirement protein A [Actinomycetota bacterium]MBS1899662.1 low temperature requirement protein A [Actinomycetota bacterium]
MTNAVERYRHGLRPMRGRPRHEPHRAATPLEALYDLVFAAAFGVAGAQFAAGVAAGHGGAAVGAFAFATAAVIWAWINFAWFASAFDTDDWLFRVFTMVQMSGVIVLAIGLPRMFESLELDGVFDNRVMVAGYIVMRVGLLAQWLRAARDPAYRRHAITYVVFIAIAQLGWVVVAWAPLPFGAAILAAALCWLVELGGPVVAERKGEGEGRGTPWHAHHIAERYSLLTIIALGETVIGTLAAAQEISETQGWTGDAVVVIGAGVAMTFALWWSYTMMPSGAILAVHRRRSFVWGYGHAFIFASVAAVGAGLHAIGYAFRHEHPLATPVVILMIAIPVIVFMVSISLLHSYLVHSLMKGLPLHALAMLLPVLGIVLAFAGLPLWACLLVVLAGPVLVVVAYEAGGWRLAQRHLDQALAVAA